GYTSRFTAPRPISLVEAWPTRSLPSRAWRCCCVTRSACSAKPPPSSAPWMTPSSSACAPRTSLAPARKRPAQAKSATRSLPPSPASSAAPPPQCRGLATQDEQPIVDVAGQQQVTHEGDVPDHAAARRDPAGELERPRGIGDIEQPHAIGIPGQVRAVRITVVGQRIVDRKRVLLAGRARGAVRRIER